MVEKKKKTVKKKATKSKEKETTFTEEEVKAAADISFDLGITLGRLKERLENPKTEVKTIHKVLSGITIGLALYGLFNLVMLFF